MKFTASVCLALLSSATCLGGTFGWTSSNLDGFGYTPIQSFSPKKSIVELLERTNSEPILALQEFKKKYEANDTDEISLYGYLYAAYRAKRTSECVEVIAKRCQDYNEKSLEKGIRPESFPDQYIVGYTVGLAMLLNPMQSENRLPSINDLKPISRILYGRIIDSNVDGRRLSRASASLLASAYYQLHSIAKVRQVLQPYSDKNPKDIAAHLFLCRAYGSGTVKIRKKDGTWIDPPLNEQANAKNAKREALAAYRLDPNSLDAVYFSGYYSMNDNVQFTKKCWMHYLSIAKDPESTAVKFVKSWLANH